MYHSIKKILDKVDYNSISAKRKNELQALIDYVQTKIACKQPIHLNFICTHNSRRSQFSQLWAHVAAEFHRVKLNTYSGGVEETAFDHRAVESLTRFGFKIRKEGAQNPPYFVQFNDEMEPIEMYSKKFDAPTNPSKNFASIMTCSHADENCPFIPGSERRLPIRYDDPKIYDGSPQESAMYDYISNQIATEMMFIFSNINNNEFGK